MVVFLLLFLIIPFYLLPTISYEHISFDSFTSAHILTVDFTSHEILPAKAMHQRETVSTIARRYHAAAAINGGFGKLNGDPAGALKIYHRWLGFPMYSRGAIGWSNEDQKVLMDRVEVKDFANDQRWESFEHIVGGAPLLIKDNTLIEDFRSEHLSPSFLMGKYPRTAIGIKENGDWVFVVIENCCYGLLGGMTIKELSEFMFHMDCSHALNLDGGRSSTMVLEGKILNSNAYGSTKEQDKWVEKVSDAILIF